MNGDGVDGMLRIAHALDLMEEGGCTVDGLEMGLVVLGYRHRVTESLKVTGMEGEEERVTTAAIAHGDEKAVDTDKLVAQRRIAAVMAVCRDRQGVLERCDISGELVFGINRIVHRTVDAFATSKATKYRGAEEEGDDTSHELNRSYGYCRRGGSSRQSDSHYDAGSVG